MKAIAALFLMSCAVPVTIREPRQQRALTDREIFHVGIESLVDVSELKGLEAPYRFGSRGSGSVVGFDADGSQVVLTAAHVFELPTRSAMVTISADVEPGEGRDLVTGSIIALDRAVDLALIKLRRPLARRSLTLGTRPHPGDPVYWFGNPSKAPMTFGRGVMNRVHDRTYVFSGFAWQGSSGGFILDDNAELIGVVIKVHVVEDPNYDGYVQIPDIAYAVKLDDVRAFLASAGVR